MTSVTNYAPVAQLDRVLGFEPRGRRFESCRVYQDNKLIERWVFYFAYAFFEYYFNTVNIKEGQNEKTIVNKNQVKLR